MARGVQIAFTLNPRDFVKGLKTIDTDLEKVTEALKDVKDAGDDALSDLDTDKAERGLADVESAAGDAEGALKDLSGTDVDVDTNRAERGLGDVESAAGDAESALGDLGSGAKSDLGKVETAAEQAGREIETEIAGGADKAEDAFAKFARGAKADMAKVESAAEGVEREIGDIEDEANQSAKEFGASFRGDPVEALEEVQSYLSEIIAVKLPGFAGAAATIAGGAVLGLVVAGVEKWREKQERINEYATTYVGIMQEAVNGPLEAWKRGYDELIEKQIAIAILEEASAAQLGDIAMLAAARGESADEYVNKYLAGEITTQEELGRIQQRRNDIADELLRITTDNNAANDANIPILLAEDAALQEQGASLRRNGGFINENIGGYNKAKTAQDNVTKATEASQERQRGLNAATAAQAGVIDSNTGKARALTDELGRDVNKTIRVTDGGTIAAFNAAMFNAVQPAYKTIFVTEVRRDAAAASRGSIQP